jgi:hypothetical protein
MAEVAISEIASAARVTLFIEFSTRPPIGLCNTLAVRA